MSSRDYPRLLTTAVGTAPDTYRGVLWRVMPDGSRVRLADCPHKHRQARKALACAETLAILDGAPQV
jgi:hypothetical protein